MSIFGGVSAVNVQGYLYSLVGTSVSAPTWAGVIARLNEISLTLTNQPLGFINPLLYQMQAATAGLPPGQRAFNDVVIGNNVCPQLVGAVNPTLNATLNASNCQQVCKGYYAVPGWDPVSRTHCTHA